MGEDDVLVGGGDGNLNKNNERQTSYEIAWETLRIQRKIE